MELTHSSIIDLFGASMLSFMIAGIIFLLQLNFNHPSCKFIVCGIVDDDTPEAHSKEINTQSVKFSFFLSRVSRVHTCQKNCGVSTCTLFHIFVGGRY